MYEKVFHLYPRVTSQDCSSRSDNADYMGSISVTENNEPCEFWSQFYEINPATDFRLIDSMNK